MAAFQLESPAPPLDDVTRLFSEGPWSRREAEVIGFDPELSQLSPDIPAANSHHRDHPKGRAGYRDLQDIMWREWQPPKISPSQRGFNPTHLRPARAATVALSAKESCAACQGQRWQLQICCCTVQ